MRAADLIGNTNAILHYLTALQATGWDWGNDYLTWMTPHVAHAMVHVGRAISSVYGG